MGDMIRCPKCGKLFEDNKILRYGWGGTKNTAKFLTHVGMKITASTVAGMINPNLGRGASAGASNMAKTMGLTNLDGCDIKCPRCGTKIK